MSFIYDTQEHLEEDIDKIQTKTGMYISYLGSKGAGNLTHEGINNALDEGENPNSPCTLIDINYDKATDTISIEDNGRGIKENDKVTLDILCTKLNSGSKFTRQQGGDSAGENGVGLTAINALSENFRLTTYVEGEEHTLKFKEGKKIEDIKQKAPKEKHGTIISFNPSKKFLGKNTSIPYDEVMTWVESLTYFMKNKLRIMFTIMDGLTTVKTVKMKAKKFNELFKKNVDKMISNSFIFENTCEAKEEWRDEIFDRNMKIQFVFGYSDAIEPYIDSYCNFVNTINGGVHLDTVRDTISRYLLIKAKESMTDKEKEKMIMLKNDVLTGLNLLVNLSTNMQIQFAGQTKGEASNPAVIPYIKDMVDKVITEYFDNNSSELKSLIKIIKLNMKARYEVQKIKNSVVSNRANMFDDLLCPNFVPATNRGKQYKEIFAIEGRTAKGSGTNGRDPNTQAFFAFRGFTTNAVKNALDKLVGVDARSAEWRQFVSKLGCNIGPKFDLDKLEYDKIIILSDSDVDGGGISAGICSFIYRYLRPIIEAGKLYKALTPLYKTTDKNHEYVTSKQEFVKIFDKKLIKKFKLSPIFIDSNDISYFNKEQFHEFLYDTSDYQWMLKTFADFFKIHDVLIEKIAIYLHKLSFTHTNPIDALIKDDEVRRDFTIYIQEYFPEMILGKKKLSGVIDGKFKVLAINNRLYHKVKSVFDIYDKYGGLLLVNEKGEEETTMSILEYFKYVAKYIPQIIYRYKGVGETNGDELWNTTLNPETRVLIRLTTEDCRKEDAIFDKLYGSKKADKAARKAMMLNHKVRRVEIDT